MHKEEKLFKRKDNMNDEKTNVNIQNTFDIDFEVDSEENDTDD